MNVTAVLVTRGNVSMQPVLDSLPPEWETVIWDNSGCVKISTPPRAQGNLIVGNRMTIEQWLPPQPNLSVYGRYEAIKYAKGELIFVCDDDVIVSDPQAIVDAWQPGHVVCNMPSEFRPHYPDSGLVGFGACFERDLPAQAFARFEETVPTLGLSNYGWSIPGSERFNRECDAVFATLTPRILVDVPKIDREFASDPDRLWKQPNHNFERKQVLDLARLVRDA